MFREKKIFLGKWQPYAQPSNLSQIMSTTVQMYTDLKKELKLAFSILKIWNLCYNLESLGACRQAWSNTKGCHVKHIVTHEMDE